MARRPSDPSEPVVLARLDSGPELLYRLPCTLWPILTTVTPKEFSIPMPHSARPAEGNC